MTTQAKPLSAEEIAIPLTGGGFAIIDKSDVDIICKWKWARQDTTHKSYAVRTGRANGRRTKIYLHRVLMNAPDGMMVDHINGDGLDNRRSNLRLCVASVNNRNRHPHTIKNKYGFRGVYKRSDISRRPYGVSLKIDGHNKHLGYYATAEEAARAYDAFAIANTHLGCVPNPPHAYARELPAPPTASPPEAQPKETT